MKLTGNTILVTGGGTGIGRGLAEALAKKGNTVIVAGRRKSALDETVKATPGMHAVELDVQSAETVRAFAERLVKDFPALNVLVNNAGIMRAENLLEHKVEDAEATVTTNLLGPIRLTAALLPHLQKQPSATIINVTSGLAFVPLAPTATYCATKAALHSYTESLRYQLKKTSVEVLELAPPYVQTDLMNGANDPRAMPLKDFIAEVMRILETQPTPKEILVERVLPLRNAERGGKYDEFFTQFNDAMAASR